MLTIIETPLFTKLWPRYWYEEERGAFAAYLAEHPLVGDVIPGTGGLRKVRWSRAASGKSSGVRVIYTTKIATGELFTKTLTTEASSGWIG